MRNACGQRAEGLQFLGVAQLLLQRIGLAVGRSLADARDRIADGPPEAFGAYVVLADIVLGPGDDAFQGQCFMIEPGQHDDGDFARHLPDRMDTFDTRAVGKTEIQQYRVGALPAQCFPRRGQRLDMFQFNQRLLGRIEHVLDQAGVAGIVLDQQDSSILVEARHRGSLTMVNQKSSTARTID